MGSSNNLDTLIQTIECERDRVRLRNMADLLTKLRNRDPIEIRREDDDSPACFTSPWPRKLLVLDLDNTLIFSSNEPMPHNFTFTPERGLQFWTLIRPGLYEFLTEASKDYDLAVWTAGGPNYAKALVSRIMPLGVQLKFVYDNTHCSRKVSTFGEQSMIFFKPLRKIWRKGVYTRKNTLILDDNPVTYVKNYGNAVAITPFNGDLQDRELFRVGALLKKLRDVEDVRFVQKDRNSC